MPLKETNITTDIPNILTGLDEVKVYYSDELSGTGIVSSLAFSSAMGGYLPYLFVSHFTDGKYFNKWYFSNARRHQEMRQAVETEIGDKYQYTYGQIWFVPEIDQGKMVFERLELHSKLPNPEDAEKKFFDIINPKLLEEDFRINVVEI